MKNQSLKNVIFLAFINFLFINYCKAQYEFIPDQTTGKPLTVSRYENITGTPYLIDLWLSGEVKLANGSIVKPKAIKYDVVSEKLLFQQDGKIFEFFPKVAMFKLIVDNQAKTFIINDKNDAYYEVLADGNVKLLKKTKKVLLERKGYNSATVEKVIDENIKYFVIVNGKQSEVKLDKNSINKVLPEYKTQLNSFVFSNDQKEVDFTNFVKSLNKL